MLSMEQTKQKFNLTLQSLENANYILADKKIKDLLQIIATSNMLYNIFDRAMNGFDYYKVKEICIFKDGVNADCVVTLPSSSKDMLAFCFSFFYEIQSKELDWLKVLDEYFYLDGNKSSAFENFKIRFLHPFKDNIAKVIDDYINGQDLGLEYIEDARDNGDNQITDTKSAIIPDFSAVIALLDKDKKTISKRIMRKNDKLEINYIIDMLKYNLENNEAEAIPLSFLAYKFMAKAYSSVPFSLKKITKLVAKENLI